MKYVKPDSSMQSEPCRDISRLVISKFLNLELSGGASFLMVTDLEKAILSTMVICHKHALMRVATGMHLGFHLPL